MLKDTLKELIAKPDNTFDNCKLGSIINSQDKETQKVLVDALSGDISTMSLIRALNAEGIKLSREYLGTKRAGCFKNENGSNSCCMNNKPESK
jgi:hypothetical protein